MTLCKVGGLLDVKNSPLTVGDRATLTEHLSAGTPACTLATALRAVGHRVGATTIKVHRSGVCSCHT